MVGRQIANLAEDFLSAFPVVLLGQESRRLRAEDDSNKEDGTWQQLKSEGNEPLSLGAARDGSIDGIIDPEPVTQGQ